MNERLTKIEYAIGLNSSKPKVFKDLENQICDLKAAIAVADNDSQYRDTLCE